MEGFNEFDLFSKTFKDFVCNIRTRINGGRLNIVTLAGGLFLQKQNISTGRSLVFRPILYGDVLTVMIVTNFKVC